MDLLPLVMLIANPTLRAMLRSLNYLQRLFQALLSFFAMWLNSNKSADLRSIPGPVSLPIFGSLWLYTFLGPYTRSKYHLSNMDKYRLYGPVVREEVFLNYPLIHLYHKDDIQKILQLRSDTPLRPANPADVYYRLTRTDVYNNIGMVNLNGEKWKELRSLLTPPLTKSPYSYADPIGRIIDDFVEVLDCSAEKSDRIIKGFHHHVYRVALEMVCTIALERRLGFIDCNMSIDIQKIMDSVRGYQTASCEATYGVPWWQYLPKNFSGKFTDMVRHKDVLLDCIGRIVDETFNSAEMSSDYTESNSIIRQLKTNNKLDYKEIKSSVVDYIIAGVDTIGNSIIFAVASIAQNPTAQRRLQAEVDHVFSSGADLNLSMFQKMPYLRACVKESFRIHPTADQIARILDDKLAVTGGYTLPAGTIVFCQHRLASLQEENFSRPYDFIPERWIEGEADPSWNKESSLVIPFGFGKRACPGKKIAELELYIMLAKLFHAFDISLLDEELQVEFNFLLTPAGPLHMSFTKRQPHSGSLEAQ